MQAHEVFAPARVRGGGLALVPVDQAGQELVASLLSKPDGVMVTVRSARNPKHHRLFFALLKMVQDSAPVEITTEALLLCIKHGVGHVEEWTDLDGVVHERALSISFESMPQKEFNAFFDAAIRFVCKRLLVGSEFEAVKREVLDACK